MISFLEAAYHGTTDDDSGAVMQSFGMERKKGKLFEVIVAETAPFFSGHKTAAQLQKSGINVNLITDASVYAVMSRVDKVIISTHAIMANGGLIANSGAYMIAMAAKVSNRLVYFILLIFIL